MTAARRTAEVVVGRAAVLFLALFAADCATLSELKGVVQPPRFSASDTHPAELRVLGPSATSPIGGLSVRLWAKISNPNPFGFTLSTLRGTLFLEGNKGADADFPLGLPLRAGEEQEVPLDLSVSFSDLPGLARIIQAGAASQRVAYRFDGTVGVDAGRLGQPTFGPMTLLTGELRSHY